MRSSRSLGAARSLAALAGMFLWPLAAWAQPDPSTSTGSSSSATTETMLITFGQNLPALWNLAEGLIGLIGIVLLINGLLVMKEIGERRGEHTVKGVVISLFAGTMLVYLSSTISTLNMTLFATSSITAYSSDTSGLLDSTGVAGMQVVVGMVNLIGLIAVSRGLYNLHRIGNGKASHDITMFRIWAFVIGGILCLNVVAFANILEYSVGIQNVFQSGGGTGSSNVAAPGATGG